MSPNYPREKQPSNVKHLQQVLSEAAKAKDGFEAVVGPAPLRRSGFAVASEWDAGATAALARALEARPERDF